MKNESINFKRDFNRMLKRTPETVQIIAQYERGLLTLSETITEILDADREQTIKEMKAFYKRA